MDSLTFDVCTHWVPFRVPQPIATGGADIEATPAAGCTPACSRPTYVVEGCNCCQDSRQGSLTMQEA